MELALDQGGFLFQGEAINKSVSHLLHMEFFTGLYGS